MDKLQPEYYFALLFLWAGKEEIAMLKSVEGIYRDGKVELLETPEDLDEARVIVTFLPARAVIDLREHGISEAEAAELRWRLQAFAEDWEHPDMDVYNDL